MNKHGQNQATVVLLMGPTASGKTELALQLSRVLACEIISVDSALVYRKMNIGTAKPTRKILQSVPHHLIDIRNPNETYSAAQFCDDANQAIERIVAKGRLPLLVGGTMLYFRSLQQGLAELPAADPAVRRQIEAQAQEYGWTAMHKRLEQVDPSTAARVHPNDPQRIQRALEVYLQTGRPMSELHQGNKTHGFPYTAIKIALAPTERANLHERIRIRFQSMLQAGFIEEVAELVREYALTPEMPAMRAVGYRQVLKFLHGELTYEEMQERGIIATRQLAKRQLTWLRSEQDLHWLDASNPNVFNGIMKIVNKSAH